MDERFEYFYDAFRILIGLLFFSHGLIKFMNGAQGVFLAAGVIEVVVGALIAVGYLARYAAMLGAIEMVFAWFIAHVPQGWNYFSNGGEPALLFLAAFLAVISKGSGELSLKKWEPW